MNHQFHPLMGFAMEATKFIYIAEMVEDLAAQGIRNVDPDRILIIIEKELVDCIPRFVPLFLFNEIFDLHLEKIKAKVFNQLVKENEFQVQLDRILKSQATSNSRGGPRGKETAAMSQSSRHCAFCLQVCSPVKLCGRCRKRAYCSRKCQIADWSPNKAGQGHKNWCGKFEHGEEDVDYVVQAVPGKGLGVIAKRLIPAMYRIIVEPVYMDPFAHPAIADLQPPLGSLGTLDQKFEANAFEGDTSCGCPERYVALRISRVNHACDANSARIYCGNSRVEILYSSRPIQNGEEICISYQPFTNLSPMKKYVTGLEPEVELRFYKSVLKLRWGISCPDDCICNSPKIQKLVFKGRKMKAKIQEYGASLKPVPALKLTAELLKIQDSIHSSSISIATTHYNAFRLAIMSKKTLSQANGHIRKCHEIISEISPLSKDVLEKYEREMKDPKSLSNYLVA